MSYYIIIIINFKNIYVKGRSAKFPSRPTSKKRRASPSCEAKIKLFALWKSLSFFATTGFVLFVHNTPLLHRCFTGKKILRSVLQKEFYTVSTGFSTGYMSFLFENPHPFRFWKHCVSEVIFFPPRASFFYFHAFFFPQRQKTIFFLFCKKTLVLSLCVQICENFSKKRGKPFLTRAKPRAKHGKTDFPLFVI